MASKERNGSINIGFPSSHSASGFACPAPQDSAQTSYSVGDREMAETLAAFSVERAAGGPERIRPAKNAAARAKLTFVYPASIEHCRAN